MLTFLERLRAAANRVKLDDVLVGRIGLACLLNSRDDFDAENDTLRLENERLLKALGEPTKAKAPAGEMCCGGTCVRAACFIHGSGATP